MPPCLGVYNELWQTDGTRLSNHNVTTVLVNPHKEILPTISYVPYSALTTVVEAVVQLGHEYVY